MLVKVLVSYAHDESTLAGAWKDLLEGISAGVIQVWFSSDLAPSGGLSVGQEWRAQLYQRLEESHFVLAIQTPASSGRPWVMWECGLASGVMKERGLIPVVYAMGRGDLANPLSTYQVYPGEDKRQVRRICEQLATMAGLRIQDVVYDTFIATYLKTVARHHPLWLPDMLIPAGEFWMGSGEGIDDERPVHQVRISQPFYLGKYAVTQAQWEVVMGNNPSRFKDNPHRPVENVSWEDVQAFIRTLNGEDGAQYRLPTEAEWEYACRAGATGTYCFGNNSDQLGQYAWYEANSGGQTQPVGQLQPNAWGLHDMHGNVYEWVHDWYGTYPPGAVTDPRGPSRPTMAPDRINRGGSWDHDAWGCRSARRGRLTPDSRRDNLGFRLLRPIR